MPDHPDTPATGATVRATRHDGWTPERQRLFFETLAAGHSVLRACARVGLSRQAAYKARRRDPAFAREWYAAQQRARLADEAAFLEMLPERLRRAMLAVSAQCELRGAPADPAYSVRLVNPL